MPWACSKAVTDEENADEDRGRESDKGSDSRDGEERAGCEVAAKNEQSHEDANSSIEPDGVDRGAGAFVDLFDPEGAGKTVVPGVGEGYSGRCDLEE